MPADPLQTFHADRKRAFTADDPMAALCIVANTSEIDQRVEARTLVLRDAAGDLALFVNATSPKWSHLIQRPFALTTYWPSVQLQYRLQVSAQELDPALVHESWKLRPTTPQQMDWLYSTQAPQSTVVSNREALLALLDATPLPTPLTAPDSARGLRLQVIEIERLDLTMDNGVHDRTRSVLEEGVWQQVTLIP